MTLLYVDELAEWAARDHRGLAQLQKEMEDVRRERVAAAREVFVQGGVKCRMVTARGERKSEVLRHVRERDVDLVVLRARGPADEGRLGATTQRVLRHGGVPALVVRVDGTRAPKPAKQDALPRYRRVLACTDLGELARRGIVASAAFAERVHAELLVTHVVELPGAPVVELERSLAAFAQAARDDLHAQLTRHVAACVSGDQACRELLLSGRSAARVLAAAAVEHGVDLISLAGTGKGAFQRLLLGSTAEALARRSPVPTLVFPREALTPPDGGPGA